MAINITSSSNVVMPERLHTDPHIFFINDLPFVLLFHDSTISTAGYVCIGLVRKLILVFL